MESGDTAMGERAYAGEGEPGESERRRTPDFARARCESGGGERSLGFVRKGMRDKDRRLLSARRETKQNLAPAREHPHKRSYRQIVSPNLSVTLPTDFMSLFF